MKLRFSSDVPIRVTMNTYVAALAFTATLFCAGPVTAQETEPKSVRLPDREPVQLRPYAQLAGQARIEPSGLVKSRLWEGIFWSHNDSGDEPRIFPVHKDGSIVEPERYHNQEGVRIPDAVNVDWEDIAIDDRGNLIIGDFGNSSINNRRDLALYFVIEPYPTMGKTSVKQKVFFSYPDQRAVPATKKNFDSEALFWARGKIYILTKHRSDTYTKLYRLDSMTPAEVNPLTLLDTFNIDGKVTAADADPDGNRLAVLTYSAIWLFEIEDNSDNYFDGRISWLPIDIGQCEAICFDGDTLILSSGEGVGDLFEVPLDRLSVVKE